MFRSSFIHLFQCSVKVNFVFDLCCRWTACLLLLFSLIITCKLAFGDSFSCLSPQDGILQRYLEMKCYFETVYTQPYSVREDIIPRQTTETHRRFQSFYPWVNLVFLAQAVISYLPYLLWKTYESGRVSLLTADFQTESDKDQRRSIQLCYLAKYLVLIRGKHKLYTLTYITLEVCNFVLSVGQTIWLENFFNVSGNDIYEKLLSVEPMTWSDYRNFYFPPSGMCKFYKYSASGDQISFESACILPLNHLYMFMFLITRAWFIILCAATAIVLIYRLLLLQSHFRVFIFRLLDSFSKKSILQSICQELSYGDWFFLVAIHDNMNDSDYSRLVKKLAYAFQSKNVDNFKENDNGSFILEGAHKELDKSIISSTL